MIENIKDELDCLLMVVEMHEKLLKSEQNLQLSAIDEIKKRIQRLLGEENAPCERTEGEN